MFHRVDKCYTETRRYSETVCSKSNNPRPAIPDILTMNKPVITLIRHHHNAVELLDNAVVFLSQQGFKVQHKYPFDGELLPVTPEETTPTIILGGGQNITDIHKYPYLENELRWIDACLETNQPLLGICLGGQLLAHTLGATISARHPAECEFGFYDVKPTTAASRWLPSTMRFMQAHFQEFDLPNGAELLASSERFEQQAFRYGENAFGMQFHPEVNTDILDNWLQDDWSHEMLATRGAQSVDEQLRLSHHCLIPQKEWFDKTLESLFIHSSPTTPHL